MTGQAHPGCRCAPGPAGVNAEPPLADLGKAAAAEDESRLAWLLLRARDEDGKWRFLLQQRPDGSWGMPGGKPHVGEDSWAAAVRETTEEIGQFPPPRIAGTFHHVEDDGKTQVYLWLCDVPYFHPTLDGATPEETRGAAWFRRKEIAALDLAPKFREDWEKGICLREHVTKSLSRRVNENGEVTEPHPGVTAPPGGRRRAGHTRTGLTARNGPTRALGPFPERQRAGSPRTGTTTGPNPSRTTPWSPAGDDGKMPSRGRKPNPPGLTVPGPGRPGRRHVAVPADHAHARSIHRRRYPRAAGTTPGTLSSAPSRRRPRSRTGRTRSRLRRSTRPRRSRTGRRKPAAMSSTTSPRARSTSPTPTPSNGGTCDAQLGQLSRRRDPVGEAGRHGWDLRLCRGRGLIPMTRTSGPPATSLTRSAVRPRHPRRAGTPNPSILSRSRATARSSSSTATTGRSPAGSSASPSSPTWAHRPGDREAAEQTHSSPVPLGSDPANKVGAETPARVRTHNPRRPDRLRLPRTSSSREQLPGDFEHRASRC